MMFVNSTGVRLRSFETIAVATLAFWLSGSLFLDFVMMPTMWGSGMMAASDFASTGYSLFWIFNRVEVVCSALILTGVLIHAQQHCWSNAKTLRAIALAVTLLVIALTFTYGISPAMSELGLNLDLFATTESVPAGMDQMHGLYFGIECLKLLGCGLLMKMWGSLTEQVAERVSST
jgi:hypothetical protein